MNKTALSILTNDTIDDIVHSFEQITHLQGDTTNNREDALFFYHGNHIASTMMVTDWQGNVSQAVMYAPFGEITQEYNSLWHQDIIPNFTFSGKILDEESGMNYFEARYLKPPSFISRDVLFEKYFWCSGYAYCSNNPIVRIDPDGREDVIYLVDLQGKNKLIDPEKLISKVNEHFEKLGLNTRMALAPDGKNFDPSKIDKTDSYAVLGSFENITNFVKNKDDAFYQLMQSEGFTGGAYNPEVSQNGGFNKPLGQGIAIDAKGVADRANMMKVDVMDYAALTVLHGAGHNATFNHSDEANSRYGQLPDNCAIMTSGNTVETWSRKGEFGRFLNPTRNGTYRDIMKEKFGNKPAKVNYKPTQ